MHIFSNYDSDPKMTLTNQSIKKPFENIELSKLLDGLRQKNSSSANVFRLPVRLEPSFHPGRGFFYPDIELTTLEEQTSFLESFGKTDIVTRSPSILIMQCSFCNSHKFSFTFVCKLCKSPNILRGSAISHEPCGNIDLYDKYVTDDGTLVCQKCNKNLKAIGLDYSKLDHIYNCLNCKALLSDIDQFYKCLDCGKSSTLEESRILLLNEYVFDVEKLSNIVNIDKSMLSVIKELDKLGIKAVYQGAVTGVSRMPHIFSLVVYAEKVQQPFLVADIIETDHKTDEMRLLSFIGKCVDTRIKNKIIVAVPSLEEEGLRELINANGIMLVELRSKEHITFELVKAVEEIYQRFTEIKG
jgi:Thaumarchaeal output domain 1